jgi:hypothetical protein
LNAVVLVRVQVYVVGMDEMPEIVVSRFWVRPTKA